MEAARQPPSASHSTGETRIATALLAIFERAGTLGITAEPSIVNGGPGIINRDRQGKIVSVLSLEVLDGLIQTVRAVVNPDKLRHLGQVSDLLRIRAPGHDQEP